MSNTEMLIKELVEKHGKCRNNLMPVLQGIVEKERHLSEEAMKKVAEYMDISAADVYGTASFYTFLDTVPRGRNLIRICQSISCDMKGKDEIIQVLEKTLKIKVGETTHDGNFSLLKANCIGWCHKGPAMLINDDVYTELTPQTAIEAIEKYVISTNN